MTDCIIWDINADTNNIRSSAIKLRSKVVNHVYLNAFSSPTAAKSFLESPRTIWRSRCLDKAEIFLGKQLSGTIVEIGAGSGWCSALLSNKETVSKVYALDYDPVTVNHLMPAVFTSFEVDENKITRVIGSYNAMDLQDESVDYVVSMGALHHSESLISTFIENFRILRPGGLLIACEPCYSNSMTVSEQRRRENEVLEPGKVEKLYGSDVGEIKAVDNSDHFYRLSEYEMQANEAGFDAYAYVFDSTPQSGGRLALAYRYLRDRFVGDRIFSECTVYEGFKKIIFYPYFAKKSDGKPVYDALLLLLVKPSA